SSFLFNDAAPTESYTLSLHDALPIFFELDVRSADRGRRSRPRGGAGAAGGVDSGASPTGCETCHHEITEEIPPSESRELARIVGHHPSSCRPRRPNIHGDPPTAPDEPGVFRERRSAQPELRK